MNKYYYSLLRSILYYRPQVGSILYVCIAFFISGEALATNVRSDCMISRKAGSATVLLVITVCTTTVLGKLAVNFVIFALTK